MTDFITARKLRSMKKYLLRKYKHCITYLSQKDFKHGTYRITKPGIYRFTEDIIFDPEKDNDYIPQKDTYTSFAYSLGFFAAITVECEDVIIDLCGYLLAQSLEHSIQQRFYANIELSSAPFIPGQGPGNFGSTINCANKCVVMNGKLGRSSHHGIHGNMLNMILIEKLEILDFEVAGIAINFCNSLRITRCKIGPSNNNVPVLGTYSAGRFLLQFAKKIPVLTISGEEQDMLKQLMKNLDERMKTMFRSIIESVKTGSQVEKDPIFYNKFKIPDGNMYGILIHPKGVAINELVHENSCVIDGIKRSEHSETKNRSDSEHEREHHSCSSESDSEHEREHRRSKHCDSESDSEHDRERHREHKSRRSKHCDSESDSEHEREHRRSKHCDSESDSEHDRDNRSCSSESDSEHERDRQRKEKRKHHSKHKSEHCKPKCTPIVKPCDIYIDNNIIEGLSANVMEIPGLSQKDGTKVQLDVSGSVFQINNPYFITADGKYIPNDLTKLQLFLAELSLKYNFPLGKNSINKDLIDWSKSNKSVKDFFFYPGSTYKYKLDSDEMFHINKGVFGIRADATHKMVIKENKIRDVANIGRMGNTKLLGEYKISHDDQTIPGYHGADTTGINLSYCDDSEIKLLIMKNIMSNNGESRGIRLINKCKDVELKCLSIHHVSAGILFKGKYIGEDYDGASVDYSYKYPNLVPNAIGIKESDPCKNLRIFTDQIKISDLSAPGVTVPIWLQ